MPDERSRPVLLAEDSDDDRYLMSSAWKEAGIENPLVLVNNGLEALDYLAREGPRPLFALLDLKMPGKDGFEVLAWVRATEAVRRLPVIILSASAHVGDVANAYGLGANAFLMKPTRFEELVALLKSLKAFWLESNRYGP